MAHGELFEERLRYSVIGAFYEVYNTLGFGFFEHIYAMALERELISRGHRVAREVAVRVMYKGEELGLYSLRPWSSAMYRCTWKCTHAPAAKQRGCR